MNMPEMTGFILGLRSAGCNEKKINDFLMFIGSGEEKYKPKPENNAKNNSQTK